MSDKFSQSFDLTTDCGGTVSVPNWSPESVTLSMGGDLSISIRFSAKAAREFARALLAAADETIK